MSILRFSDAAIEEKRGVSLAQVGSSYGAGQESEQEDNPSQSTGVLQSVFGYEGIWEAWPADLDKDRTAEEP